MALRYGSKNASALRYNPFSASTLRYGSKIGWTSGGATPNKYFTFTLLEDDTYSIEAKDITNMPTTVVLPSEYEGKAVTVIADNGFKGVDLFTILPIENIYIPASITTIGNNAFSMLFNLKTVKVLESSNLTHIGKTAFYMCGVSITTGECFLTVDLENATKLTEIGTQAMANSGVHNMKLPNSITSIGDRAFESCVGLIDIVIPNGVTFIAANAFRGCDNLTIYCEAESQPSGWVSGWNYNRPVVWGYTENYIKSTFTFTEQADGTYSVKATDVSNLPSVVGIPFTYNGKAVTVIEDNAFKNATTVTKVVIPSGVTSIGSSAFEGCTNLTEIIIPDTVTTIGSYAFANCETLPTIIIPSEVTTMEHYVFWNCYALSIYCQASSQPSGWSSGTSYGVSVEWNPDNRPVTWGYTG